MFVNYRQTDGQTDSLLSKTEEKNSDDLEPLVEGPFFCLFEANDCVTSR